MIRLTNIVNDLVYECCPLCFSHDMTNVGKITYESPLFFSTSLIDLEAIPELWTCNQCNSSFTQNRVPEKSAVSLYSDGVSADRWSYEKTTFKNIKPSNQIECLKRYFVNGKKVLDIGCNTGELLDYARIHGCETAGVEYSLESIGVLKNKNHCIYNSLNDIDGNEQYDVITAFDLVEHLYDIPCFFRKCKQMLSEGGVLIILTGNIESFSARFCKSKWWYVSFPEHIVFPSRKYLVQHSGFSLCEWIKTYASNNFKSSFTKSFRRFIKGVINNYYNGLPCIEPDHVLVVLRK